MQVTDEGVDGPKARALFTEIRDGGAKRLEKEPVIKIFPFCEALGMRLLMLGDGESFLATPYRPELVGDPATGVIHGGVVTALLDTAAGMAAAVRKSAKPTPQATLDLRIDYMRPAAPDHVIFAKARCYRRTRQISFLRAVAFEADQADPVAVAYGVFMRGGKVDQSVGELEGVPGWEDVPTTNGGSAAK